MAKAARSKPAAWERRLNSCLPLYGHRNWIVVVDSAFPVQSNPGIETILADASQIAVVRKVVRAIAACKHIRANAYTDRELRLIEDADAPGMDEYRRQLDAIFAGKTLQGIPHAQIMTRLNDAAKLYNVLVIKTNLTIPYTSVFLELDCGYWAPDAEKKLRRAMVADGAK
ncbi:MAG: RbsD/FucU domain-containing protein [Terracidiphilus sp.]